MYMLLNGLDNMRIGVSSWCKFGQYCMYMHGIYYQGVAFAVYPPYSILICSLILERIPKLHSFIMDSLFKFPSCSSLLPFSLSDIIKKSVT